LFDVAARAYSVLYNIVYEETNDPIAVLAVLDKLGVCARKAASNQVRLFGLIAAYEIETERGDELALQELDRQIAGMTMTLPRARAESLLPSQALRTAWSGDFIGAWRRVDGTAAHQSTPERRAIRAADTALYAFAAGMHTQGDSALQEARGALAKSPAPTRRTIRAWLVLALGELLRGHAGAAHHHVSEAERALAPSMHRLRTFAQCVRTLYRIALGQSDNSALLASLERMRSDHLGGTVKLIEALPKMQSVGSGYTLLTATERGILELLVRGASTKEVAGRTDRSPQTIDTHIRSICRKLQCSGRRAAVALAVNSGWTAEGGRGD
jgi:DNA-binding CsgD family transcriptional regulator